MNSSWHVLQSGPGDAAFNMAMDEALLEALPRLRRPVLRFYSWNGPAASFGYFQNYSDVERAVTLRPLVRRPTGGGMVPHEADWTYSLAFPVDHDWYSLKAIDSYRRVHEWIRAAFASLDVHTELAPEPRQGGPGQCFGGHERSDLLWRGKKIAGAAQRRTRDGLLIQGSIQPPPPLSSARALWEKAMRDTGRAGFRIQWFEWIPDPLLSERARHLATQKYSLDSYNQKR